MLGSTNFWIGVGVGVIGVMFVWPWVKSMNKPKGGDYIPGG